MRGALGMVRAGVVFLLVCLALSALTACGGGGGGGSVGGSDPLASLPYAGSTTPAVLAAADVAEIVFNVHFGSTFPVDSPPGALAYPSAESSEVSPAAVVQDTVPGLCGGLLRINITINESTGAFQGTETFEQYNDCELTINGTVNLSGQINLFTGELDPGVMSFELLRVVAADSRVETWSGQATITESWPHETLSYDVRFRDESTGKVYWLDGYQIALTHGFDTRPYVDETIVSGRFYDPDRGYVDQHTVAAIRTYEGDAWPTSGVSIVAGGNGSARLSILSPVIFRVEADLDNDGTYDEYDTGLMHFPGANTPPVAVAGEDSVGNVGCQVSLDGTQSMDGDQDVLQYVWAITSAPVGSVAPLSSTTSPTPLFTPDVIGDYGFTLSVSDGIDLVEDALVLTVYGDLFCLGAAQLTPFASNSQPGAMAIGDVTGDALNDVVVATASFNTQNSDPAQDYHLYVFAQNGQGQLSAAVSYPAGDGNSLGIADLNGDGRMDVAVTATTGVGVFYQDLNGQLGEMQLLPFGETAEGYDFNRLVVADFTSDGRADIVSVYSKFESARVRLYVQSDVGTLEAPILFTTDPGLWLPQVADINGDTKPDLVLTSNEFGRGSVFMGAFAKHLLQGAATLTDPVDYPLPCSPPLCGFSTSDMALDDFNGDGRVDVVAHVFDDGTWFNLYAQLETGEAAEATLLSPPSGGNFYQQLETGDIDGDGRAEFMAVESGNTMSVDILRPETALVDGLWERYPLGFGNYNSSSQMAALGDLNNDGVVDLAAAVFSGVSGGSELLVLPGNAPGP